MNLLTNNILTFNIPILAILFSNAYLFPLSWLTISYSLPIITNCESVLLILVLPPDSNPKVVIVINVVLGGILT